MHIVLRVPGYPGLSGGWIGSGIASVRIEDTYRLADQYPTILAALGGVVRLPLVRAGIMMYLVSGDEWIIPINIRSLVLHKGI